MAAYTLKLCAVLLLIAVVPTAGVATTERPKNSMIDAKSEKTAEDLEKVKQTLVQLNEKHVASLQGNGTEENPHLKEVMAIDLGPKSNESFSEHAMNTGIKEYLMGGDIAVNPHQAAALVAGHGVTDKPKDAPEGISERRKRDADIVDDLSIDEERFRRAKRGFQTDPKYAWDITQPIPYFFDSSLSASSIAMIKQGIAIWQNSTCINFVENASGTNALRYFVGAGCYAAIGRQGTATQDVSIGIGCDNLGTVMHETNHAIGFFHTMERPDRDDFIYINYNNVAPSEQYNFNAPGADNSFGVNYDYGSVMQYDQYAWAINSSIPTMVALDKWMQNTMGQRAGAAFSDIKQANLAYNCPAKCPGKTCSNGGIANSRDCTKCLCPDGFGGDSCEAVAVGNAPVCNGAVLTATAQPQTVVASAGTNDYVAYPTASTCYWMINSPAGTKVVFTLTAAPSSCVQNCVWQGVEIMMGNFDTYGVTMCCPSFVGQAFTATGNLAIVKGFARSNLANFSFTYNYV